MEWYEIVISILSGIAACIPLAIKLVEYVQKAAKEKNWGALVAIVKELMIQAEKNFDNGADRKEWVLTSLSAMQHTINYDIDMAAISQLIDTLCDLSKKVNAPIVLENP